MTRAQVRTILRRRLQETSADQWTDANLNEIINLAYQRLEMDILAVNPDAFIATYRADIVLNQQLYEKPAGFNWETCFKVLDQDTGTYKRIELVDYNQALTRSSSEYAYSHYGADYFFLSPKPTAPLAAGIELDFVPSLTVENDTDVPKIVLPLHMGIVHHATIMGLGETGESLKQEMEALALIINRIPGYYLKTSSGQPLTPAIDKGY